MTEMEQYHVKWTGQGKNSGDSMPVGGCDVGCNVWTENNFICLYIQESGWFDENNSLLKFGRLRIGFEDGALDESVAQELVPEKGYQQISCHDIRLRIWAEVHAPVVHIEYDADRKHSVTVFYETWRAADRTVDRNSFELFQCKEVFMRPDAAAVFHKDTIEPGENSLTAFHRNLTEDLCIYKEYRYQGIPELAENAYNPQKDLIFGGILSMPDMKACGTEEGKYLDTPYRAYRYENGSLQSGQLLAVLHCAHCGSTEEWKKACAEKLEKAAAACTENRDAAEQWWTDYFNRSRIRIGGETDSPQWKIGRNYQLFRYMTGCNYYGYWPVKFNGGLFTFDPGTVGRTEWYDGDLSYTPDFRLWGGGSHTIQNQRLVYWPMLRSGDTAMMPQQFDLFARALGNVKQRVREQLGIGGAFFAEQMGIYGLCNTCDHGWDNHTPFPVPQIKYLFSNNLEICLLILKYHEYTGRDISGYMDLIGQILQFYDSFYPQNDENGKMVLYPANALETYHMVKNPVDAVAGLRCVLEHLLRLPEKEIPEGCAEKWKALLKRVPEVRIRDTENGKMIAYADTESEIFNCELPEMYSVFPYERFGIGKPGTETARNTIRHSFHTEDMKLVVSWHYTGIEYARLGMLDECVDFLEKKLKDGPFRFPAFWGPGHDWTPDHNWGGSGEIQLQEMLMQTEGDRIFLFPCWPADWDVSFRLQAPKNTAVDCIYEGGVIRSLKVFPEERRKDVIPVGPAADESDCVKRFDRMEQQ